MPPSQEITGFTAEIHYATQALRVMLWNFTLLFPIFEPKKNARKLHQMVQESIPALLAFFAEVMGAEWYAPRVPAATADVCNMKLLLKCSTAVDRGSPATSSGVPPLLLTA